MKYEVKNLRTGEVVIYEDLDRAECFIRICVMYGNDRKPLNEKRWTKKDFQITKIEENN